MGMEQVAREEHVASPFDFPNAISPFDEMLAYEILWSIQGQSLRRIESYFDGIELPSEALNLVEGMAPNEDRRKEITAYLSNKQGFSVTINGTCQYPDSLYKTRSPYKLMYYRGDMDLVNADCVSIVGTRNVSLDGLKRTKKLTTALVKKGFNIVSGLAAGVDTEALKTAIEVGGRVIGVIGTPIDEHYPKENKNLQEEIATRHLLLSHVPFYRYEKEPFTSHKFHFPERNGIMAAVSKATIIVEASDTSGTLTQARACLKYGRKLLILNSCFEVPGLKWPHKYLEKGAIRIQTEEDLFRALEI